jgi:hypothetical protein
VEGLHYNTIAIVQLKLKDGWNIWFERIPQFSESFPLNFARLRIQIPNIMSSRNQETKERDSQNEAMSVTLSQDIFRVD